MHKKLFWVALFGLSLAFANISAYAVSSAAGIINCQFHIHMIRNDGMVKGSHTEQHSVQFKINHVNGNTYHLLTTKDTCVLSQQYGQKFECSSFKQDPGDFAVAIATDKGTDYSLDVGDTITMNYPKAGGSLSFFSSSPVVGVKVFRGFLNMLNGQMSAAGDTIISHGSCVYQPSN